WTACTASEVKDRCSFWGCLKNRLQILALAPKEATAGRTPLLRDLTVGITVHRRLNARHHRAAERHRGQPLERRCGSATAQAVSRHSGFCAIGWKPNTASNTFDLLR